MSIFVCIPSYRDSECQHTVRDLLEKAANPTAVSVGICFQYDLENDKETLFSQWPTELRPDQIRIDHVDYREATGPCWARYRAHQLYRGEEFVLSIDSHMRFIKNWDQKLIQLLQKCDSTKPILTTYPLDYTLPNTITKEGRPTLTCADRINPEDGMLRLKGRLLARPYFKPLPQMFWVSGFSFSRANILKDVPYDPFLPHLFFGEESSMTLRLWTHGWDFFAPGQNIIYHLWTRDHRPIFRENRDVKKEQAEMLSRMRIKYILGSLSDKDIPEESRDIVTRELDKYGLGAQRTREQFFEASGVNFVTGQVAQSALWGGHDKSIFFEGLLAMFDQPPATTADSSSSSSS